MKRLFDLVLVLALVALPLLSGCGSKVRLPSSGEKHYTVRGITYYPVTSAHGYVETGLASWYGANLHGKRTASGEPFDMHALTAAHKMLPLGALARVTFLATGKSILVRINDRGPFTEGYVIDLSYAAAKQLGTLTRSPARVKVEGIR